MGEKQRHRRAFFARHIDSAWCAYCGGPAETIDHVVPKCAGGTLARDNSLAACHRCNGEKADRALVVFLAMRQAAGTGHWSAALPIGARPGRRRFTRSTAAVPTAADLRRLFRRARREFGR